MEISIWRGEPGIAGNHESFVAFVPSQRMVPTLKNANFLGEILSFVASNGPQMLFIAAHNHSHLTIAMIFVDGLNVRIGRQYGCLGMFDYTVFLPLCVII